MRFKPRHLLVAIVLVALVSIVYLASSGNQPGMKQQDGDVIVKNISSAQGDATASFQVTLQEGGDAVHESDHIFEALGLPSVESVSLDTKTLQVQVRFDSSQTDEAALRKSLSMAGYLAPSAADETAATISADGASQQIDIASGEGLQPALIGLAAGVPAKLNFGPGAGHLASITIPDLNIQQDLTQGATVQIDDPKPGTYAILCAEGVADGTILVE